MRIRTKKQKASNLLFFVFQETLGGVHPEPGEEVCAEHVWKLEGESPLSSLMEVKD